MKRAFELVPVPLQLLALAAAVIAVVRLRGRTVKEMIGEEREMTVVVLFLSALAWVAMVAVTSKVANYAGIARFQHPAAALFAVLAGAGAVWLAALLGDRLGRRQVVAGALAAVVVLALVPSLPQRARRVDRVVKEVQARSTLDRSLGRAVTAAGGRERVVACGATYTIPGNEPQLAWRLERHIEQIDSTAPRRPATVFRVGASALREPKVRRLGIGIIRIRDRTFDPVANAGVWQVMAACRPGVTLG